ncbi:protein FAM161B-like [Gigantopelta aegis]|uniref:protein FAM161B-like n=1 Tax=Gigantopelta aegis TaxID=1735272 RepID=UPI001B88908B|nr:protein FAM161B-like [Gigantopelta aegis]
MATMATSHKQSVLTNSLVKPPINPYTGKTSTLTERPLSPYGGIYVEDSYRYEENCNTNQNVVTQLSEYTPDEIAAHLRQLSDDEFYNKLVELKDEQKKALQRCEELYQETLSKDQRQSTEYKPDNDVDELFDRNQNRPVMNELASDMETSVYFNGFHSNGFTDNVMDLSTKPPIASPAAHGDLRSFSSTLPLKSRSFKERPGSAPARWGMDNLYTDSLDEDDWQQVIRTSSDENLGTSRAHSPDDFNRVMKQIDNMWERFSIENYAPKERRHSSSSLIKRNQTQKERDNWRHRLTIPKPFKMTLREENKEKKRTSAQIELENRRLERLKDEEAECLKTFKASPAPAHIYLPLYDEIMEKNEARRRYVKTYCQEMLKSQEKPFNFVKREEERKKLRCNSAPPRQKVAEKVAKSVFKAKPVPDYLFDKNMEEKIQEEEEYRKIRIRMRSEELLREAALPSNMEMRQRLKEQKLKEQKLREKDLKSRKNKIKGLHKVPDYDALFRQFQKEMSLRRVEREPTIPKPFSLSDKYNSSVHKKCLQDTQSSVELGSSRNSSRRPVTDSWSSSLDAIPYRTTTAQDLRSSMNRSFIERLTRKEQEELEEDERQRRRGFRLRKTISQKVALNNSARSNRQTVRERLRKFKESDRNRQEVYERELEEIKRRVDQRPMLFEEESKKNAKKLAEKKFSDTLKNAGIKEDVSSYASSTVRHHEGDGDYASDSFEISPLKTDENISVSDEDY